MSLAIMEPSASLVARLRDATGSVSHSLASANGSEVLVAGARPPFTLRLSRFPGGSASRNT